jgi:diacylglycerol kinase (ATP)
MLGEETIPADARLVLIAANPRSGARSSREVVGQLAAALSRERLESRVMTDLDELTLAASAAQRERRLRAVVAAGGDGTLAELVNRTSADTPLAVFPLGTANLMANYLGLEPRVDQFAAMLAAGKSLRLDAARAWSAPLGPNSSAASASPAPRATSAGRIFLIMASVGFDAAVVASLHSRRSGHIRMWSYAKPIWDCVRSYSYPRLRCECAWTTFRETVDSRRMTVAPGMDVSNSWESASTRLETTFEASWLFVQNLPCYAGGLRFAPRATGRDGLLDVCGLEYGSFWHGLRYLCYVLSGRHEGLADCRMERVERIRVSCDNAAVPVQFDGDPGGQLPLEIESLPLRVRLIGPEGAIARLEAEG